MFRSVQPSRVDHPQHGRAVGVRGLQVHFHLDALVVLAGRVVAGRRWRDAHLMLPAQQLDFAAMPVHYLTAAHAP